MLAIEITGSVLGGAIIIGLIAFVIITKCAKKAVSEDKVSDSDKDKLIESDKKKDSGLRDT
jgi:hypothetical protein